VTLSQIKLSDQKNRKVLSPRTTTIVVKPKVKLLHLKAKS
jgi:hypothetical protein